MLECSLLQAKILSAITSIANAKENRVKTESKLTFAISLYKLKGYETPKMKMMIIARLSVRIHRNGVLGKLGNIAVMTCGIVSPTMMQNATIPPNAL